MKFKIEINCENAAFEGNPCAELAYILDRLTKRLRDSASTDGEKFDSKLWDSNGNSVGAAYFEQ